MSNPKRNDPCPCGSGKKYKKCCGLSNVIEISPQLYNDDLDDLHHELLAFSLENYKHEFTKQTDIHYQPSINEDPTTTEAYLAGLTLWTILNVPILENSQTIFDVFYDQQKDKIKRTGTKRALLEWANVPPSVYEVISIDNEKTHMITIKELGTDDVLYIPIPDEDDTSEGSLLIGILVPYVGYHCFLFNIIEILSEEKEPVYSLFHRFSEGNNRLKETFPNFLAEVLLLEKDIFEWDNPLHEMVAELFTTQMHDKGFDDRTITSGLIIWYEHCQIKQPRIQKIASYAAALEYFVQIVIVEDLTVTQKQIAAEYGTTAGSVSTNYRKLIDLIEQNIDKVHEDFDSIEDTNEFSNNTLINEDHDERIAMSPRDTAQDLLFDAQNAHGIKRKQLINNALDIYPNSSDAYILLAEDAASESEYRQLVRKAVLVGEKDLGKAFFLENKGHFWMQIETRPYMRAKALYANFLYEVGEHKEALKHFDEMLRLNPNDNQGIRYILLTLLIELGQFNDAQKLITEMDDDQSASFLFNKALVHYLTNGVTKETKQFIKEAKKQNQYIKDYLLGNKHIPDQEYDYIGFGDETEAIVYAQEHFDIWEEYPEILKEL